MSLFNGLSQNFMEFGEKNWKAFFVKVNKNLQIYYFQFLKTF